MINPLDLLNKFIGAIIAYGPKNKTKKARRARKAARRKKLAAMKNATSRPQHAGSLSCSEIGWGNRVAMFLGLTLPLSSHVQWRTP